MVRSIDIKRLNLDELLGVVSIYPWYAGARRELCARMAEAGTLSEQQLSQAALYIWSRRILFDMGRRPGDYSEAVIRQQEGSQSGVLENAKAGAQVGTQEATQESPQEESRRIFVVGGDYFSSSQYKEVRRADDSIYSSFATSEREGLEGELPEEDFDFCTETLAQIYAEQGYTDQARQIYSKLSLRYPEKSVYFASLIEKLD